MELKKFKKIYMNKRVLSRACREKLKAAFTLLSEGTEGISFEHFLVFMKEYKPETPSWQVLCMYKALLSDKTDLIFSYFDPTDVSVLTPLSLDRFYGFYQVAKLKWIKDIGPRPAYFEKLPSGLRSIFKCAIILANLVYSLVFAGLATVENRYELAKQGQPGSLIFTFSMSLCGACNSSNAFALSSCEVYCVEIALRIIGMGPLYFRSGWNWFDLVIISISTISQILEFVPALGAFIVLRSLRLFSNTSWYFVGAYYAGGYNSTTNTVFWLNNFDNLARSYVTLFEQVVVNNWFVMMEGFASQVESQYAYLVRVYFIVFQVLALITTTVIVSYIVEGLTFKITMTADRRKFKLFCKKQHGPKCGCFMSESMVLYQCPAVHGPHISVLQSMVSYQCPAVHGLISVSCSPWSHISVLQSMVLISVSCSPWSHISVLQSMVLISVSCSPWSHISVLQSMVLISVVCSPWSHISVRDAHKKRVRANLSYEDLNCLKTDLEVNHRELKEIAKRSLFRKKSTITVSDPAPVIRGTTTFFGTNYRARDDLYLMMYEPEIVNWHNALPKEAATQAEKLPWKSVLKEKLKETIEYIMD
eukprot:Em0015g618a